MSEELTSRLELVVRAVPGVAEVFRARPGVGAVATHLRAIADTRSLQPVPRVVLDDGQVVRVTIGTDGEVPTPAVARAVHDAVLAEAALHGVEVTRVDVTIARVG
jgi:hypothetical protein